MIQHAWRAKPEERPKAIDLVNRLRELLQFLATQADCAQDEEFATTLAKAANNNDSSTTAYMPESNTKKMVNTGLKVMETIGDTFIMLRDSTFEGFSGEGLAQNFRKSGDGDRDSNGNDARNPIHALDEI